MRIYGKWAGNPKGRKEDPKCCIASVYPAGRMISSQCSRKRGHGPDGAFCKQHARMQKEGNRVRVPREATP